jgi:hypothetical protein
MQISISNISLAQCLSLWSYLDPYGSEIVVFSA